MLLTAAATGLAAAAIATAAATATASAGAATHKTTTTTAPASATPTTKPLSKADQWLAKALKQEVGIGSVHIDGSIKQGKKTITLHLVVNGDGQGGGTFVQQGNTLHFLRVGPLLYFKAPTAFWAKNASTQQAETYGDKWLELSSLDSRFQSFDQFLSAPDLTAAVFQGHTKPLTVSKPTTFNGHRVVIVKEVNRANGKTAKGYMYIGAIGKPYVYGIFNDTPGEVVHLTFSHYGGPHSVTVPAKAINLT